MLDPQNSLLLVIDFQEKLLPHIYQKESVLANAQILIKSLRLLKVPILWSEQAPKKIGKTVSEIARLLNGHQAFRKYSFSCLGHKEMLAELQRFTGRDIILCGIETHVCVYQTALDLLSSGFRVQIVTDAISSRTAHNRQIGLDLMRTHGCQLTSTETVLCELVRSAQHENFKEIIKMIK